MEKLRNFSITFANSSAVFYAGSLMQGHVTMEVSESMEMRGIGLTFEGRASVYWTETESTGTGKDQKTTTKTYSSSENYFKHTVLLFGIWPSQGRDKSHLPAGTHTFPFQFQLPEVIPSSFEGFDGNIRYTVRANIDRPWKFDKKALRPFTVIQHLDLNQQPGSEEKVYGTNEKNLCCLCCASGPITAEFYIDRKGYVPGEAIKLFADISNGASRSMDKSFVDLIMITTFHATMKSRSHIMKLARLKRPGFKGHSEDQWTGEELVIPPVPPSFLKGCRIIDIQYILQLNVDPSGPSMDLEVALGIIVGTIPLRRVVEQFPPMPPSHYGLNLYGGASNMPSAPSSHALYPQAPPSGIPSLPPPSFCECITGKVDIREAGDDKHTIGDTLYAPVYTYYNWGHTPQVLPQGYHSSSSF